ncbi:MAG: SRPBCC family protein [Bacteroidota bacterium]
MIDLTFDTTINKPIDEVWKFIIDEFHNSHEWAYGTMSCRKGTESEDFDRVCDTETGKLMDTITNIDDENHVLEFSVKGLPFFVRSVVSTWKLKKLSNTQTEIVLGPRIEVMPVIGTLMQIPMKMAFSKLYPGLLDDLATFVETGKPSARKQKEIDSHKSLA